MDQILEFWKKQGTQGHYKTHKDLTSSLGKYGLME